MTVVPVHAPGTQHALHVAIVPWAPDMIHDLVATIVDNSCADFGGECVQHLVPVGACPFAFATFACTFQGAKDAFRLIDLGVGRRTFGAVASPAAWWMRAAFEFVAQSCFLI